MRYSAIAQQTLTALLVGLLLVLFALGAQAEASDSFLTTRINQIESQLSRLSAQVSQLQSQIGRGGTVPPATQPPSPSAVPPDDQFDNLATLAIELREDLRALEARVAALEE